MHKLMFQCDLMLVSFEVPFEKVLVLFCERKFGLVCMCSNAVCVHDFVKHQHSEEYDCSIMVPSFMQIEI